MDAFQQSRVLPIQLRQQFLHGLLQLRLRPPAVYKEAGVGISKELYQQPKSSAWAGAVFLAECREVNDYQVGSEAKNLLITMPIGTDGLFLSPDG